MNSILTYTKNYNMPFIAEQKSNFIPEKEEVKKKPYIPQLPEKGILAPTPIGQPSKTLKQIATETSKPFSPFMFSKAKDIASYGFTKLTGVRPTDFGREVVNILGQGEELFGTALGGGAVPYTPDYKELQAARAKEQEMNNKLVSTIKAQTLAGKDTKRLKKVLVDNMNNAGASDEEINEALKLTTTQILGASEQTLLDILTAGTYSSVMKTGVFSKLSEPLIAKTTIPTVLGQFKLGLKTAATGGAVGYGYDVSTKMMEDNPDLTPSFMTAIGAGLPLLGIAGKLASKEQKLLRKEGKINEIIDEFRQAYNPLKSDIRKMEEKSGAELDDTLRFLAEEEMVPQKDSANRLDTRANVDTLQERKSNIDKLLAESLDDSQQINDLDELRKVAKERASKYENNAELLGKKLEDIDNLIDAEIARYGRKTVTDLELHKIKNGMWNVGYDMNRVTKSSVARTIGNIMKTTIQDNNLGNVNVEQLNNLSGDYGNAIDLLSNLNGNVVQGGKLGGWFYRMLVGFGVEKLLGNIPGLRGVSFFVGQFIGKNYNEFLNDPQRIVNKALERAKKIKLDKRSEKVLKVFEEGLKENKPETWQKIVPRVQKIKESKINKDLNKPEKLFGIGLGFETYEDEQGNTRVRYNPTKAMIGVGLTAAGSKLADGSLKKLADYQRDALVELFIKNKNKIVDGVTKKQITLDEWGYLDDFSRALEKNKEKKGEYQKIAGLLEKVGLDVKTALGIAEEKELAQTLRGTKGMTADDIMATYPNIKLKRDVPITDIYGNKVKIEQGEKLTPYELKGNKILLQDGETYIVSKSQFQNIKGQSVVAEGKPFAPELEGLEETVKGGSKWQGDELVDNNETVANLIKNEDGTWSYQSDFSEGSETFPTREQAMKEAEAATIGDIYGKSGTKYENYTLPGGKNYKEILIKAPEKKATVSKEEFSNFVQEIKNKYGSISNAPENIKKQLDQMNDNAIEGLGSFRSSHWEEPNVISHLRLNEREYKGKKVTFMEELQSDWAREARAGKTEATAPQLNKWQELSVKRALKEAVNSKSDYFAWITGEQTSNRYNLATQVDNIRWRKPSVSEGTIRDIDIRTKDGTKSFTATIDKDGKVLRGPEQWRGHKLDEVLGKGLADKIMASEKGTLSGEGLKFGGEWANNLYDKQVKSIVEDLTGAKVEMLDMRLPIEKEGNNLGWRLLGKGEGGGALMLDKKNAYKKMKVGEEITRNDATDWIVTDILGDGKFRAVPKETWDKVVKYSKEQYEKYKQTPLEYLRSSAANHYEQTFDISQKTTKQMGIRLTPEVKARIKGEAPKIKTSGKMFEDRHLE